MKCLQRFNWFKNMDESQRRKLREQAHIIFVAVIWIGLFVLMLTYSAKHNQDLPLDMEPRVPSGSAKFL